MKLLTNWLRKSIYRAILLSFVLVAVVPLVFISFLYTRQSMEALTAQMEENLVLLAQSKAEEINLKLGEVMHSTLTAAHMAEAALQQPVAAEGRAPSLGELARLTAAELKCYRVLGGIETEQSRAVTMNDGAGGQHLGVEQRAPRQQPVEETAMPVGPVHHGCAAESPPADFAGFRSGISHLCLTHNSFFRARFRLFFPFRAHGTMNSYRRSRSRTDRNQRHP